MHRPKLCKYSNDDLISVNGSELMDWTTWGTILCNISILRCELWKVGGANTTLVLIVRLSMYLSKELHTHYSVHLYWRTSDKKYPENKLRIFLPLNTHMKLIIQGWKVIILLNVVILTRHHETSTSHHFCL